MIKVITKVMDKHFINKSIVGILLIVTSIVNNYAMAEEKTSVSFGALSKSLTTDNRHSIIKENKTTTNVDQHIGKATGKTRTEILASKSKPIQVSKSTLTTAQSKSYNIYADFAFYSATSLLEDDFDSDGFYQTFSVRFDADIYSYTSSQLGEVYALLYISKNGGPWTHYYTTDNFFIEGNTDLDEYEVITTFLSGYTTDHYDILIDLYQAGYSDIVASYSADDTNALYALSLESADYDEPYIEPYIEVIEISHGGSFSLVVLMLFLLIFAVRKSNRKH